MSKINYVPSKKVLAVAIASVALTGCFGDDDDAPQLLLSGGNAGNQVFEDNYDWNSVGGEGGWLSVSKYTGPGDIRIVRSGSVNAKFDRSAVEGEINTDLGENPLIISGARTIGLSEGEPAEGTPYFGPEGRIYVSDGDTVWGNEAPVTGLRVNSGATLTLEPNESWYGNEGWETASFYVPVLDNRGTIRVQESGDGSETGSLGVYADTVISSGTIDLRGAANAESQYRRDGGRLSVQADAVFIDGKVLASGGAVAGDSVAGHGGSVYIYTNGGQHHRGVFELNGGNAVGGEGGDGGYVFLASDGPSYNQARIAADGGDGLVGGDGGGVFLAGYGGDAWNAGNVTANGGNGSDGTGGDGGQVDIYAYGGELRNNASYTMRGGAGGGIPVFGGEGNEYVNFVEGSRGGDIYAQSRYGYASDLVVTSAAPRAMSPVVPAGSVAWSGNIDLRGGSAPAASNRWGGEGGYVDVQASNWSANQPFDYEEEPATVTLYGYGNLVANGGKGHYGGEGGGLYVDNGVFNYYDGDSNRTVIGGGIEAVLNVVANGGAALAGGLEGVGFGGEGGGVYLETSAYEDYEFIGDYVREISYTGGVAAAGGSSLNVNNHNWGRGGYVEVYGYDDVTVTSGAAVPGARDAGAEGTGGRGGRVQANSYLGDVTSRVTLAALGGYGAYQGGRGGALYNFGANSTHNGAINVKGGNANTGLEESYGGSGGYIVVLGDLSSVHSGATNYAGGVGSDGTADEGCFIVGEDQDGLCDL